MDIEFLLQAYVGSPGWWCALVISAVLEAEAGGSIARSNLALGRSTLKLKIKKVLGIQLSARALSLNFSAEE